LAFELIYVYFFIIETKGRTLEETAAIFDGEEVAEAIKAKAQQELQAGFDVKSAISEEKSIEAV
jgi:hypothetical protein